MAALAPIPGNMPETPLPAGVARIASFMADFSVEATRPSDADIAALSVLPRGTQVYVSAVPGRPADESVGAALRLRAAGFEPVPHVAVRNFASAAALDDFLARLTGEADVHRVLVIASDRSECGPFRRAHDAIDSGVFRRRGIRSIGVAGYPDGHPKIGPDELRRALAEKIAAAEATGLAVEIVTQFCFDARTMLDYVARLRAFGFEQPVRIGLAGPTSLSSLLRYASRCGVRTSAQALAHGLALSSRSAGAFGFGVLAVLAFLPQAFAAEPVKAEATLSASGGFARLTVKFAEDVTSEVVTAGSIIVIRFERPVDVVVDKVADAVPDYVGSARRDPDGSAIRLSLSRKVTINTMTAGERLFVDLLPDSWTGPPPSLPQDVVRELAERARAAERELRQQRAMSEAKKRPPVRVRASVQPTFVRFIFEMPDGVGVSSVLNEQKLKLMFSKALTFDLADAKISAPPNVSSISQKIEGETATVELIMLGDVDVHSFREEKNYVIDVAFQQADKAAVLPQASDAAHPPAARVSEKPTPSMAAAPAPAAPVAAAAMTPAAPVPAPAWPGQEVACTASRITPVTVPGLEIIDRCGAPGMMVM